MLQHFRPAIVMLALFTALTGIIYPLAVTGIAGAVFPALAEGSMVTRNGTVVGSILVGQNFAEDKYFHSRPSATSAPDPKDDSKTIDAPYNAANSSGSNLGPISQKLVDRVKGDVETLQGGAKAPVPADAVTTSASGLDPHISPDYARLQVTRVAKARNLPETKVKELVESNIDGRWLGIVGEPRVNVLKLNLALDALPAA